MEGFSANIVAELKAHHYQLARKIQKVANSDNPHHTAIKVDGMLAACSFFTFH